jgi:hypothetical protein
MRSFNWLRNSKIEKKKPEKFHPWHVIASKIKAKDDGRRANAYSQCDMIKMKNGRIKLAFVALYPMEKGWFLGREELPNSVIQKGLSSIAKKGWIGQLVNQNYEWIGKILLKLGKDKGSNRRFVTWPKA